MIERRYKKKFKNDAREEKKWYIKRFKNSRMVLVGYNKSFDRYTNGTNKFQK